MLYTRSSELLEGVLDLREDDDRRVKSEVTLEKRLGAIGIIVVGHINGKPLSRPHASTIFLFGMSSGKKKLSERD